MKRDGFTLIELLVVIAIIAILSVVVVLSLNPAELLRQSRDANRLSDLSTLNSALALYTTDQAGVSGFSLGNASSVYVSLPDSSSTCGTWSLPALPSGYTYACSTSTSSKNINSSGWIPANFSNISGGAPFSNLPIDNTNQSSTGLYYAYYSNGSQFITTAIPESQKQKAALGAKSIIQGYPEVLANGSNLGISPLFNTSGFVGYWPLDEGTGTVASDLSGNGNNGTLYTAGSNLPTWSSAKIGTGLNFDGSTNSFYVGTAPLLEVQNNIITITYWLNIPASAAERDYAGKYAYKTAGWYTFSYAGSDQVSCGFHGGNNVWIVKTNPIPENQWAFIACVLNGSLASAYQNGLLGSTTTVGTVGPTSTYSFQVGSMNYTYSGVKSIDDFRVYSRALSPAEIQALYNAEK